jgi:peptide/nickel transport system permease protein
MPLKRKYIFIYIGTTIILSMICMALFAPLFSSQDPNNMDLAQRFTAPNAAHIFGQDQNGSDVFSKVVYGARVSLLVAIFVVGVSSIIGLVFGSIAGYYGGKIDQLLMRVIDMLYAFPGFLLAIAVVAVLGPSLKNLIFALCITGWTGYARLVRGEVLHLKTREYVQSARAIGAKVPRILVWHIWPNLLGPLIVQASFGMAGTIISESGLSFLGLGVPPDVPSWGALLNSGRQALLDAPHISIFPGLFIVLLVLGFNLLGDGLRDILDPKKTS